MPVQYGYGISVPISLLAVCATYVILSVFVDSYTLIEMSMALFIPVGVGAFWLYAREMWNRPKDLPLDRNDFVLLTLLGSGFVLSVFFSIALWARINDANILSENIVGALVAMLTWLWTLSIWIRSRKSTLGNSQLSGPVLVFLALTAGVGLCALILYLESPS